MDIHLVHQRLQDVNGRYLQQVDLLQNLLPLPGQIGPEVVIQVFLNRLRQQIRKLETIANPPRPPKQVVIQRQLISSKHVKSPASVIDAIDQPQQDIVILPLLKGLLRLVDKDHTLKIERLQERQQPVAAVLHNHHRKADGIAQELGRERLSRPLDTIKDHAQILVPLHKSA